MLIVNDTHASIIIIWNVDQFKSESIQSSIDDLLQVVETVSTINVFYQRTLIRPCGMQAEIDIDSYS